MGKLHKSELLNLDDKIKLLREHGFKPIAYSYFQFEDVFAFETDEEASQAFYLFEQQRGEIYAWWYGRNYFLRTVKELNEKYKKRYEEKNPDEVYPGLGIKWLNEDDNIKKEHSDEDTSK